MKQKIYVIRRNEFKHSAKGSSWKNHKYIKKVGDKYIYADTPNGEDEGSNTSDETTNDNSSASETKNTNVENTSASEEQMEFDIEEMANKVIRGEFGNGAERKELLGESFKEIQKRVNEILLGEKYIKSNSTKKTSSDKKKKENDEKNSIKKETK